MRLQSPTSGPESSRNPANWRNLDFAERDRGGCRRETDQPCVARKIPIIRLAASRRVEAIATNGGDESRPTQRMHHAFPSGAYSTESPEVFSINSRETRRSSDNLPSSALNRTNSRGFFFGFLSPARSSSVGSLPVGSLSVGSSIIRCQSFTHSQIVGFCAQIDSREHRENECMRSKAAPRAPQVYKRTLAIAYCNIYYIYWAVSRCDITFTLGDAWCSTSTSSTLICRGIHYPPARIGASAVRLEMQKYATEKALESGSSEQWARMRCPLQSANCKWA